MVLTPRSGKARRRLLIPVMAIFGLRRLILDPIGKLGIGILTPGTPDGTTGLFITMAAPLFNPPLLLVP